MRASLNANTGPGSLSAAERKPESKKTGAACGGRIAWITDKPEKGARLIARTFYRELRRVGWEDGDIMAIADELLACLLGSLREYRLKTGTTGERVRSAPENTCMRIADMPSGLVLADGPEIASENRQEVVACTQHSTYSNP